MPRIRLHTAVVLLAAAALVTSVAPAHAGAQTNASDTARVTELFKAGKAAFGKGDMPEAERLFAQALSIRKSSDIAANLAQSQLEQQKYRSAAENFAWALANLLPSATDAQRKAVETGLGKARSEIAILRLDIKPDGADVLVGAQALGASPIAGNVYVEPGEVIVSVKREGYIALEKRVMVGKGTEQAVEIELNPKDGPAQTVTPANAGAKADPAPTSAPPTDRAQPRSLVPAFVATGVAVVGGVTGLVFTLRAGGQEDDADTLSDTLRTQYGAAGCSNGDAPVGECDALSDQRDSVDKSRNLALAAFVVGGVGAIAAGYFYWDALSHRSSDSARQKRARPLLGLVPSVDVERSQRASVQSVKLGVSGTF